MSPQQLSWSSCQGQESIDSPVSVKDFVTSLLVHPMQQQTISSAETQPPVAQTTAPSPVNKRRRRRCVSFAETALLYPSDRSEEEVKTSWYSKDELIVFKKERRDTVKILKRAGFNKSAIDTEQNCLRGFEPYFSVEVNKATKCARDLVYTVVFSEQNRQRSCGISDHETMRTCSQQASQWALRNALELGSQDAAESYVLNCRERELLVVSSSAREDFAITVEQQFELRDPHKSFLGREIKRHAPMSHAEAANTTYMAVRTR